jgi:transcription elongation factor Elf1
MQIGGSKFFTCPKCGKDKPVPCYGGTQLNGKVVCNDCARQLRNSVSNLPRRASR